MAIKFFDEKAKAEYVMRSTLVKSADAMVKKAYEAAGFSGEIRMEPESYQYLVKVNIKDIGYSTERTRTTSISGILSIPGTMLRKLC